MAIRIEVSGELPPAKNEAKSMLSKDHRQSRQVRRLKEAAALSMGDRQPLDGPVRLDVTITAPAASPASRLPDATNMLGGIGDVLQARPTGADTEHLGTLASVACFHDDEQIHEIHYRRLAGAGLGYTVLIRPIDE